MTLHQLLCTQILSLFKKTLKNPRLHFIIPTEILNTVTLNHKRTAARISNNSLPFFKISYFFFKNPEDKNYAFLCKNYKNKNLTMKNLKKILNNIHGDSYYDYRN